MENPNPFILDISSDDDMGFGDVGRGGGRGGGFDDKEDHDWLSELLGEVGRAKDDDSDDVVIVTEVTAKPNKKSRSQSLRPAGKIADNESDDDCVVLDGDPDKPVVVVVGKVDDQVDNGGDSDELEIVGEKGEIACRDFPHARHLCAKFLFTSTPHEIHCPQCHCYVCDSPAPCSNWGNGHSSIDHCHASDKEDYWRAQRKSTKKRDRPVPVAHASNNNADLRKELLQTIQVPAFARQTNSLLQNQSIRSVKSNPCSVSSNFIVPTIINQGRSHPSASVVRRFRPKPRSVSPQFHTACNENLASKGINHISGSLSARFSPTHPMFKRPGFNGASSHNRPAHGSQLSGGPSLNRYNSFQTPIVNGCNSSNQQIGGSRSTHSVLPQPKLSFQQSRNIGYTKYVPSEPQVHSRTFPSCPITKPIHCQSQMPSQTYVRSNFVNPVAPQAPVVSKQSAENLGSMLMPQPHVAFQPNQPLPSQTLAPKQSVASNASSIVSSHPSVGTDYVDQSSVHQAHNSTSLLIGVQDDLHGGNHTQNGVEPSLAGFGFNWDSSVSHVDLQTCGEVSQSQGTVSVDISQYESTMNGAQDETIDNVVNFHRQNVLPADDFSKVNDNDFQLPESTNSDSLNFQFGSWLFENHSPPGALEVPASPVWNAFSPELDSIDTGSLFDM